MKKNSKTFTVWTIEAPPEPTVRVNRIVDLVTHITDLAMCYLKPGGLIVITTGEMTQEEWDATWRKGQEQGESRG